MRTPASHVLVVILFATEVLSMVIPRDQVENNPALVRRMTDELIKKVENGEALDPESIQKMDIPVGNGTKTQVIQLDPAYFDDDSPEEKAAAVTQDDSTESTVLIQRAAVTEAEVADTTEAEAPDTTETEAPDTTEAPVATAIIEERKVISSTKSKAAALPTIVPVYPTTNENVTVYNGGGVRAFRTTKSPGLNSGLLSRYVKSVAQVWPGADWTSKNLVIYPYEKSLNWTLYNPDTRKEEQMPVACACSQPSWCTCHGNADLVFAESLTNGTIANLDRKHVILAKLEDDNKPVSVIMVNGTVPQGTPKRGAAPSLSTSNALVIMSALLTGAASIL